MTDMEKYYDHLGLPLWFFCHCSALMWAHCNTVHTWEDRIQVYSLNYDHTCKFDWDLGIWCRLLCRVARVHLFGSGFMLMSSVSWKWTRSCLFINIWIMATRWSLWANIFTRLARYGPVTSPMRPMFTVRSTCSHGPSICSGHRAHQLKMWAKKGADSCWVIFTDCRTSCRPYLWSFWRAYLTRILSMYLLTLNNF